jgi:hypothetical protein
VHIHSQDQQGQVQRPGQHQAYCSLHQPFKAKERPRDGDPTDQLCCQNQIEVDLVAQEEG